MGLQADHDSLSNPMSNQTPQPSRIASLRALADPVRLALVDELAREDACACELRERLDLSAPLLSHHLKVLREAGLVSCAKAGRRRRGRRSTGTRSPGSPVAPGACRMSAIAAPRTARGGAASALAARRRRGRLARALPLRCCRSGTGCSTASSRSRSGPRWADALHFFLYDTTKILLLLVGIIFAARILRSFLSIERTRALLGGKREGVGNVAAAGARRRDAVLLVQRRPRVHRLRRRRRAARGHADVPDREPDGQRGRGRAPLRAVRLPDRRPLHRLRPR